MAITKASAAYFENLTTYNMSDLLNSASLVMIPSGYKEDVVYSQIPTSGAGDLSFTRASNGTRINSAGLVEVVAWNLVSYSSDLSNAYWTKRGFTQIATNAIAPDGSATAYKIQENNTDANPGLVVLSSDTPNGTNTFFVWLKGDSSYTIGLSTNGGTFGSNINITTSWQLFSVTQTDTPYNGPHIGGFGTIAMNSGIVLYVWHPQLNIGSTAKPYFPTTDRLNVPRLTYQNGGGGCPSLLLEKQSTNLCLYSEQFDNASWTKARSTITANATTSPDGTKNADKFIENTANDSHAVLSAISNTSGQQYTVTIYAKAGERNWFLIYVGGGPAQGKFFNLSNGTLGSVLGNAPNDSSIINEGNGWYRCSITYTATDTSSDVTFQLATSDGTNSYTGDGTSGLFIYGAQVEASSYPTSYIPTTSSSPTRVVDRCYKTSASSLIGQTSGVFFGDLVFDSSESVNRMFSITGADWNSDGSIRFDIINNQPEIYARKGGADIGSGTSSYTINKGQRIKFAVVYTASNMKLFVDGAQRGTTTTLSTTPPTCSQVYVNELGGGFSSTSQNNQGSKWNEVVLFTTSLSDAELIALTTI